jgi:5-methylcytosine-specific restriction endonuclease McrA
MTAEQWAESKAASKAYNKEYYGRPEVKAARKARYEANLESYAASSKAWRLANSEFDKARHKARYDADPSMFKASARAWKNHRRALRQGCYIDPAVTADTYLRLMAVGANCAYCPAEATDTDHVWPLCRGGAETESNLVAACADCNKSKRYKLLNEWTRDRVDYGAANDPKVAAELCRLMPIAPTLRPAA